MKYLNRKKTVLIALAGLLAGIGATSSQAKDYITTPDTQARAYSLAVTSENPKKTVYFAGQTGRFGPDGKPIEDFDMDVAHVRGRRLVRVHPLCNEAHATGTN